jgi:hypothetical protein
MNAPAFISLPFELTNSNDGQGKHWGQSAKARRQFESDLRKMGLVFTPFDCKVSVRVVRVLGKRQRLWDSSSRGRGNYKQLEDSMVACGWFHDDSPKYIIDTIFQEDDTRREGRPSIELHIELTHIQI